ncbi:hypothetical protein tloyanaT_13010 [Thalassotalea loyana]|uniref:DUF2163 domain-containing protein n=1 Tax=Thalassotalea loyana TaxID=280483 RepID=A0ABQ6HAP7_9GAMM|nr:hypothetical protein [Thalassotalea loyana]GLX85049.1 hypothetical protein tloyanaT_13010 [Thalassotalea loyana]
MRYSSTIQNAILNGDAQRILYFLELDWGASGWVRVHTGVGTRSYNGNDYIGVGELGSIGRVVEDANYSPKRLQVGLSLTDPSLIADVKAEDPIGNSAKMHIVVLDEDRRIIDGDVLFDGAIGDLSISKGAIAAVSLSLVDWIEIWNRPIENALYTDAAQQQKFPGDKFFDQVELLSSRPINAGLPGTSVGGAGGGGFGDGNGGRRKRLH